MEEQGKNRIAKEAVRMALPAVLESFFVALAGMVDSLMVSSLGSHAVAAVGLTTQPKFMGLSLFFATNVAVSALVARRRGEKRQDLESDSACGSDVCTCGNSSSQCFVRWICQ